MKTFFKNRTDHRSEGLVVDLNERLFWYLKQISFFNIIIYFIKKWNGKYIDKKVNIYKFVDLWVISNFVGAITFLYFAKFKNLNKTTLLIMFGYASLRVFEIIIYQINVNLFDRYRAKLNNKNYSIKSPTRTVILLLHNYIEIIFWYAFMIVAILKLSNIEVIESFSFYIRTSFLCMTTFNHDLVANINSTKYLLLSNIAIFEVISGLIMTIVSLANFIGRLPVEYQKKNGKHYK